MSDIEWATENLYAAFSDLPKPESINACACCMTADEVETLLAKDLRELTPEELSSYASSALLTVGDISDYLYFLPRILELSIRDDTWWPTIEVSGVKIGMMDPASWPLGRFEALLGFFHGVVNHLLESKNYRRIDEWMCAVAAMKVKMRPFLEKVEANPDAVLEYFNANAKGLSDGRLENAFWEDPRPGHDEIVKWFKSDVVSEILFDAYGYRV